MLLYWSNRVFVSSLSRAISSCNKFQTKGEENEKIKGNICLHIPVKFLSCVILSMKDDSAWVQHNPSNMMAPI